MLGQVEIGIAALFSCGKLTQRSENHPALAIRLVCDLRGTVNYLLCESMEAFFLRLDNMNDCQS